MCNTHHQNRGSQGEAAEEVKLRWSTEFQWYESLCAYKNGAVGYSYVGLPSLSTHTSSRSTSFTSQTMALKTPVSWHVAAQVSFLYAITVSVASHLLPKPFALLFVGEEHMV